jgi:hypothetical protein
MTPENLIFMHDTLRYLGFGINTSIHYDLEEQIKLEPMAFELYTEAFFDEYSKMEATLYYTRGKSGERYYLNKYQARLRYPDSPDMNREQTIWVERNRLGITFKEAFNLLQGRFVYKKLRNKYGESYMSWISLDFDNMTATGNYTVKYLYDHFELEKTLQACPIRELDFEELRERIIQSLRKGNLHPVTYVLKSGKAEKKLIFAHPGKQTINNISEATRASRKKKPLPVVITEDPDTDQEDSEPLSESTMQDGIPIAPQKAHL